MGDYPLKIAKDYRVPEHQRVNTEKKKREKLLLVESFHAIKTVPINTYNNVFSILTFIIAIQSKSALTERCKKTNNRSNQKV